MDEIKNPLLVKAELAFEQGEWSSVVDALQKMDGTENEKLARLIALGAEIVNQNYN